jgi:glycosyltransferase involved in cell wall biosynthesis
MKNLNINCPIGRTGYGITSFNIVKGLHNLNVNLSLFPIGHNIECNREDEKVLIKNLYKNNEYFDYDAPCLKIWHQHDLSAKIGNGHYYSFPFFEVDQLTNKERHNLNYCDYIFVASRWAKDVLLKNDIRKPIYVAPLGVDTTIFQVPPKIRIKNNDTYVFFHIGKWEKRKGHDFLIDCFNTAFNENDNVELWLLPNNPFLNKEEEATWINLVTNSKLKDKIKIYQRLPTQQHLAEFIFYGDCGIFLSRAEGWNNEIPECMALGKPIITTNYSAHTEYCTNENSYLVNIDELEDAHDGKWFFGEGKWAKLGQNQMDQTIEHMRYVYHNNINSNPTGLETANKYSWNNTCSIIDTTLTRNYSYANPKKRKKRR